MSVFRTLAIGVLFSAAAGSAQTVPDPLFTHRKPQYPNQSQPSATTPQAPDSKPAPQRENPAQPAVAPVQTTQEPSTFQPKIVPSAPRISLQNGELTVVAENAGLAEVLSGIRTVTGIKMEGLTGGADRVTAKIGPAPVRDVLLSLLEGSKYDFAILGSETDPLKIERLILSTRVAAGPASPNPQPQQIQQPPDPAAAATSDDDDNEGFAPAAAQPPANPAAQPANGVAPVKTPEQLLEELKKLESERNQQQQQAPSQPGDLNTPRPPRPERPK